MSCSVQYLCTYMYTYVHALVTDFGEVPSSLVCSLLYYSCHPYSALYIIHTLSLIYTLHTLHPHTLRSIHTSHTASTHPTHISHCSPAPHTLPTHTHISRWSAHLQIKCPAMAQAFFGLCRESVTSQLSGVASSYLSRSLPPAPISSRSQNAQSNQVQACPGVL